MESRSSNFVGITTCKGRLEHIKVTLPLFMQNTSFRHLLVEHGCPQKTGRWVEEQIGSHVIRVGSESDYFHKTMCLNLGAKKAIELGAEYLIFFDADTKILPGFEQCVLERVSKDKFLFVEPTQSYKDLTGLLVIHKEAFQQTFGFDEKFNTWGAEDVEFRLRLYGRHKFKFDTIPAKFFESIPHGDELRTGFYPEKDKGKSNIVNQKRMFMVASNYCNYNIASWKKLPPWRWRSLNQDYWTLLSYSSFDDDQ